SKETKTVPHKWGLKVVTFNNEAAQWKEETKTVPHKWGLKGLPIEMVEWLDEESRSRGVPISQIVEEALSLFKEKLCQKGDG
ncbi:MAG: ribbon-helix-helix domain-containing protein, partial [Candidatus Jordarchaeales archaeon]